MARNAKQDEAAHSEEHNSFRLVLVMRDGNTIESMRIRIRIVISSKSYVSFEYAPRTPSGSHIHLI